MTASNPVESSPVTAFVEMASEELFEVTPDVEEVLSRPSKGKGKGKDKGKYKENGKEKDMKWAAVKLRTSP